MFIYIQNKLVYVGGGDLIVSIVLAILAKVPLSTSAVTVESNSFV